MSIHVRSIRPLGLARPAFLPRLLGALIIVGLLLVEQRSARAALVIVSRINPDGTGAVDLTSATWTNGWKLSLAYYNAQPHVVGYRPADGAIAIERISVGGGPNAKVMSRKGAPQFAGFSHLEVVTLAAVPHLFLYRNADGAVSINRIEPGGIREVSRGQWTPGWTHVRSFQQFNARRMLFYNTVDGRIRISQLKEDGTGSLVLWNGAWTAGYSHFTPFYLGGVPHMLQYKIGDGTVHIDRINPNGQNATVVWKGRWTQGWVHFSPFRMGPNAYVLEYKVDGRVAIDRIAPNGRGSREIWSSQWGPGWSNVQAFLLGGVVYVVRYRE